VKYNYRKFQRDYFLNFGKLRIPAAIFSITLPRKLKMANIKILKANQICEIDVLLLSVLYQFE